MRHHPFPITLGARDRWVQLMDRALHEATLPAGAEQVLRDFFHQTASFLINRGST
jgi:hemoglobin